MFLIWRQQADAPNHYSHCMHLFKNIYGHAVAAMPWWCPSSLRHHPGLVVCHTACSSAAFVTAALVSFTPLRSLLPSFASLHLVRSYTFASWPGSRNQSHMLLRKRSTSHSQANATILTGFHSASLRHSFTSAAFSPPAAHNWLAGSPTSATLSLCC